MSSPRSYTVRGLDVTASAFNCMGVLRDQPGFIEIDEVPTEAKAVELMLTGAVSKMVTGVPPVASASYVDVLNIKAEVFVGSTSEAKKIRKQLAESIKTWAEKSRVRGVRGWRAHALKTPKIQRSQGAGYELDFDAILGHAVFYSDKTMSVGHTDDQAFINDTIFDLKKHLARQHPGLIGLVKAEHQAKQLVAQA
jgi:hypothetical protein